MTITEPHSTELLRRRSPGGVVLGLLITVACGSDDAAISDGVPATTHGGPDDTGTTHGDVGTTASDDPSGEPGTSGAGTTVAPGTDGSDGDGDGGEVTASTTTEGAGLDCDTLLSPLFDDPDAVAFELFDTWRTVAPPISVAMRLDDCPLDLDVDLVRSAMVGQGFFAGDHELTVTYDGVDLPVLSLDSVPRDLFWFAVSNEQPPEVFAFQGTSYFPPAAWNVNLVNMSAGTMAVYAITGPDEDPQYALLEDDIAYGEGMSGVVPADFHHGARIRIEVDAAVIFEGNPQFFLGCPLNNWPTQSGMVGIVDVVPGVDVPGLNMVVGYGECMAPAAALQDPVARPRAATRWTAR